jgi:hypothetical protein
VPVLAPGRGKTVTGRLWAYVRDERPAGQTGAPELWMAYSPDRKGQHPQEHLLNFKGVIHADGFAGYVVAEFMLRRRLAAEETRVFSTYGHDIIFGVF